MNNKKKAFTLTELLIALGIIGAIAAMCIPSLMNAINNNILCTQIKNISGSVAQLAADQLVAYKTKTLDITDFNSPAVLLTGGNFAYASTCSSSSDCWKEDEITYRTLEATEDEITLFSDSSTTILLKNGALLSYEKSSITGLVDSEDQIIGTFTVDVNGNDEPNIIGRDVFGFYVTKKGKVGGAELLAESESETDFASECKTGSPIFCYSAIVANSWKMPY